MALISEVQALLEALADVAVRRMTYLNENSCPNHKPKAPPRAKMATAAKSVRRPPSSHCKGPRQT